MSLCPCGSQRPYSSCCQPIHNDHSNASTPEQLMRSRYAAHVLRLVDFVVDTYHPSCNAQDQRDGIQDSIDSDWRELKVLSTETGQNQDEGFVTFQAFLREDDQLLCLEERSRFVRESGLWYYIDGTFPEREHESEDEYTTSPTQTGSVKLGRNDPCHCGSGKKFKKCCG
ncbi:SEC-C domain-containing protein [Vibrio profundum]|uniref:YchJ family metal-binding protein n=1 Tax=Vibrio profundum TaxID=2910247 RepID=UPI003D0FD24A